MSTNPPIPDVCKDGDDCEESVVSRIQNNDATLRTKVVLLALLSTVYGVLVGMAESRFGYQIWPMALGLSAVVTITIALGHQWVCQPYDALIHMMKMVQHRMRAAELKNLPTHRTDEVGHIARSLHALATVAFQSAQENQRLRRTLDYRIEKAVTKATRQLQQLAMRDPLTNLGNRRFVDENLDSLIASVREAGDDLICIALDLDNFKPVNDRLGHSAGDELLTFLADLIRGCIRPQDYAVRLGGDEFAIFLPACTCERARQLGEQLIAMFSQCARTTMPADLECGISIGIGSLKRDVLMPLRSEKGADTRNLGQLLMNTADENLYKAKNQGKGTVVC